MAAIDNPAYPGASNYTLQVTSAASATGQPLTTAAFHFISDKGTLPINYQIMSMSPSVGSWSSNTFTQTSINNGTIKYIPLRPNFTIPEVKVQVKMTDPNQPGWSKTVTMTILYTIPDTAPAGKSGPMTLDMETCKKFTRAQIDFVDLYQGDAGIYIKVMSWPEHGDIFRNGTEKLGPGSVFTMEEVVAGKISYCHRIDDTATEDVFTFRVRDSNNQWTGAPAATDEDENSALPFTVPITIIQHDDPLVITKNGPASVDQCETVTIDETMMAAEDPDDAALPITFVITQLPMANGVAVGTLLLNGTPITSLGTEVTIPGDTLVYEQDCSNTPLVTFYFTAKNSKMETEPKPFDIKLIPAVPPQVDITPLTVAECNLTFAEGAINGAIDNIIINDPNNRAPADIKLIFVSPGPVKGSLYLLPNTTTPLNPDGLLEFTYQDILDKKLAYKHDCSADPYEDMLHFEIVDQVANVPFALPVHIIHVDVPNIPLEVTIHGPGHVATCGELVIGPDLLMAVDEDDPDLAIEFKLTVLPLHAILYRGVSPSGVELAVGDILTLQEVMDGQFYLVQDCSDTQEDEFHFDAYHPETGETVEDTIFEIILNANALPTVQVTPLVVEKCKSAAATEVHVNITDPEGLTPDKIVLEFTEPLPAHGKFFLGGIEITAGVQFNYDLMMTPLTQLVYFHDCTVHDPWTDEAHFKIIDGPLEVPFTLPIQILHTEDKPPYMVKNDDQPCSRTGQVDFDYTEFDFTDDDTAPELVFWEAVTLPLYGTFKINGVDLVVGARYARSEWETLQFAYVANNVDLSVMEDVIGFKLEDENNTVENLSLYIKFPAPPANCPDILNEPLDMFRGQESTIPETHLLSTTDGIDAQAHVYTVKVLPLYGILSVGGVELAVGDTFTQDDINMMRVQYENTDPTQDFDTIRLQISNGGCVTDFVFRIDFLPGLKIEINNPLTVMAGSSGTIDNTYLLSSSGTEPDPTKLVYTVTKLPLQGVLKLNGVEILLDGTFTQADINASLLVYEADGANETVDHDEFPFDITDGYETLSSVFDIIITFPNLPPVINIYGLEVGEEQCGSILRPTHLEVIDKDAPEDLVFTIDEYVEFGELYKLNTLMADGDTFTYQDIIEGHISYCNTVPGVLLDSFEFTLTDGGGNSLPGLLFPITIIPPPPPELVNNTLMVYPCVKRTINSTYLNVKNLPVMFPKENMIFTITSLPTRGTLSFQNIPVVIGQTITLKEIIASHLTYIGGSIDSMDPDSFTFDVTDGLQGAVFESLNNTFNIEFIPTDNPPWVCVNDVLTIFEYETATITQDSLQLCDVDLDAL